MMGRGGLKKGSGLHLDPMILAFINFGSGLFGFPWVSVATLKALAHIAAQTVYSRNDPPGIPPSIVEIKENRISGISMSILIGLSIFMAPVLKVSTPIGRYGFVKFIIMCLRFDVFFSVDPHARPFWGMTHSTFSTCTF